MNKVPNANELKGWRTPSQEEVCVIQGILFTEAKNENKAEKKVNILYSVVIYVCVLGIIEIAKLSKLMMKNSDYGLLIFMCIVFLLVCFVALFFLKMLIINIKDKVSKSFMDAIRKQRFLVNNVEIEDVISLHGVSKGIGGHCAIIKDELGTICDEKIVYMCCNGYKKTRALLIHVSDIRNAADIVDKKYVIPLQEYDERLWNIGLLNYNRRFNR